MPAKRTVLAPLPTPKSPLTMIPPGAETMGTALIKPLGVALEPDPGTVLTYTVRNQEDYEAADVLLGRIRQARKIWKHEMYGPDKDHPGPIPLQYASLEALYALNKKFDKPMEQKELAVKAGMKAYNDEQLRIAQKAEEERLAQERRLLQQENEARMKADLASTPQLAGRLHAQADRVAEKRAEIEQPIRPKTGVGLNSTTRKVSTWKITNLVAFIAAVNEGSIPATYLMLSPTGKAAMDAQLKADADVLAAWPGVEVGWESGIVGR